MGGGSRVIGPGTGVRVYLACGVTDMRKGIAGLSTLAQNVLRQKPASGAVFVFRGRRGDRLKLLYWDGQGFCLYYIGDSTALPILLDQIDGPVDLFLADGAYDGDPTCDLLLERFGEGIEIAIPPHKNAMLSSDAARNPTIRDRQITEIKAYGRIAWQKTSGYNQRSRGETLMGRWKAVIGPKLKARSSENQKTGARIGVRVLNRMTELGRPSFERTA